jgi:hypothetical protein
MASTQVQQKYRDLAKLVKRLPENTLDKAWQELRTGFRKPLVTGDSVDARLQAADERMSFLRMVTPKKEASNQSGTWVYKDGKRLDGETGTVRDANGKVHSNWNGKNLDPCSVKIHSQQLKRMGYLNNAHAKGYF